MADDLDNRKRRTRKLPPLGNTEGADRKESDENVPKPRPKKKKRPPTAQADEAGKDLEESGQPAAGPGEGSVRKKKRRPRPKPATAADDGPSAEPGDAVDGDQETPRPRKPRKRSPRRKQQDPSGSQHSLIGQSEDGEGETPRRTPRKKKRRTPKSSRANLRDDEYARDGLAADIADLEDDIIDGGKSETEADDEDEDDDVVNATQAGGHLKSQPANKLFIEQKNRFRQEDKKKLAKRLAEDEERRLAAEAEEPKGTTTLEFALSSQKGLRIFSLFIHGILGGFSLCHFSFVLLILMAYESAAFLTLYAEIAWPVQVAYYLMFVICTVSVLDKYDVCRMNRRFLIQCLTMQNGAIAILFYFVAMILSLSIANIDDKMGMFTKNATLYWGDAATANSELLTWRNVNIARACCAIIGWFIIALQPTYDRLSQNLKSGEENILGENKEMNSVSSV